MSLAAAPLPVSYNGLDSFSRGVVLEKKMETQGVCEWRQGGGGEGRQGR